MLSKHMSLLHCCYQEKSYFITVQTWLKHICCSRNVKHLLLLCCHFVHVVSAFPGSWCHNASRICVLTNIGRAAWSLGSVCFCALFISDQKAPSLNQCIFFAVCLSDAGPLFPVSTRVFWVVCLLISFFCTQYPRNTLMEILQFFFSHNRWPEI